MNTLNKTMSIVAMLIFVFAGISTQAQTTWDVPTDKKDLKNPVAANAENIAKGLQTYTMNCKACHGDIGKNNGLPLVPKPTDPGSEAYQKMTDGEIFYKMTEGRGAMPSYKAILKDEDRWNVILYMRSLNK
ncbi:MAG: cytochrome c [Bacteroidales bacterium]|nr:cytochrome c [Bacteroidales bacterium]